ncbi:MAG: hypothetical protein RR922_00340 [Clostridia bacterium]
MKKIIIVFVICIIAVIGVFAVKNINSNILEFNFNQFISFNKQTINDDLKVNKLQRKHSYYFFDKLAEDEKKIYAQIVYSVKGLKPKAIIDIKGITNNEFTEKTTKAVDAFFADHPEVFYLEHKYETGVQKGLIGRKFYIKFDYLVKNREELNTQMNKMEKEINDIVDKATAEDLIQNEIIIHDEFSSKVEYDYNKSLEIQTHTAYGALIEDVAVCDGLSKGLQLLLDKIGIQSIFVVGSIKEGPHAWLLVNLKNNWYHVDITSNKSLRGTDKKTLHSYLNISEEKIKKTHIIDNQSIIPKAVNDEYNYYNVTNRILSNDSNFEADFSRILKEDRAKSRTITEFLPKNISNIERKITEVLSKDESFKNNQSQKVFYYKVLDTYIIEI